MNRLNPLFLRRMLQNSSLLIIGIVFAITIISLFSGGCAGPTTPLGAPWALEPSHLQDNVQYKPEPFRSVGSDSSLQPNIEIYPPRQKLHGPSSIRITIDDYTRIASDDRNALNNNNQLIVKHNGIDVTHNFIKYSNIEQNGTQIVIHSSVVRLDARKDHLIEFIYNNNRSKSDLPQYISYARYAPPRCQAFDQKTVLQTENFNPPIEWIQKIDKISKEMGFNSSFTTALIAQESGFNPKTVSWAKAIGLTQITPTADEEIQNMFASWPRYPGLQAFPAAWVKTLVLSGQINSANDWRLDIEQSVRGGLAYAQILAQRWSTSDNRVKIKKMFSNPDLAFTQLLLASYNSGYSRVLSALNRYGTAWLSKAEDLQEARNYVNRVLSYCDHFSMEEVFYANET